MRTSRLATIIWNRNRWQTETQLESGIRSSIKNKERVNKGKVIKNSKGLKKKALSQWQWAKKKVVLERQWLKSKNLKERKYKIMQEGEV